MILFPCTVNISKLALLTKRKTLTRQKEPKEQLRLFACFVFPFFCGNVNTIKKKNYENKQFFYICIILAALS
jgi:hypothetical protein